MAPFPRLQGRTSGVPGTVANRHQLDFRYPVECLRKAVHVAGGIPKLIAVAENGCDEQLAEGLLIGARFECRLSFGD